MSQHCEVRNCDNYLTIHPLLSHPILLQSPPPTPQPGSLATQVIMDFNTLPTHENMHSAHVHMPILDLIITLLLGMYVYIKLLYFHNYNGWLYSQERYRSRATQHQITFQPMMPISCPTGPTSLGPIWTNTNTVGSCPGGSCPDMLYVTTYVTYMYLELNNCIVYFE